MAALPYMQLYIADYLADTMHLSTEEHGAYLLLMFNYWQTGKAIPKNRLAKIARVSDARWKELEAAIKEFFEEEGDSWVHIRIERDIEAVVSSPRGRKLPNGDSLKGFNGYVYFITNPDTGLVKIGYSKNPWARLAELRRSYGSELNVVATIKTVDKSEVSIHATLADYRVEGEWFVENECIKSLISQVAAGQITTVDATRSYVESYCSAPTSPTNKDKDKDKDKDIKPKNIMSGAKKTQPQTRAPVPPEEIFISLPLVGGVTHPVTLDYVASRAELYPAVDIRQELRNMFGWLESNPSKRKTPNGIKKFITTWLQKCQDNPRNRQVTHGQNNSGSGGSAADAVRAERQRREREQPQRDGTDGVGVVGDAGGRVWESLGNEEWIESVNAMGDADFIDDSGPSQ
jgi:hypothetical protein